MIRLAHIAVATENVLDLPHGAIGSRDRRLAWAHARQIVMWVAYRHLGNTMATIGRVIGRDFSTVRHGIRQVDRRLREVAGLADQIEIIEAVARRIAAAPGGYLLTLRAGAPVRERAVGELQTDGTREWFELNDQRFQTAMAAAGGQNEL